MPPKAAEIRLLMSYLVSSWTANFFAIDRQQHKVREVLLCELFQQPFARFDVLTRDALRLFHRVDLQDFVAVVVDDFHGDLARLRFGKRLTGGRVKRGPSGFVDVGLEGAFEFVVGLVGSGEVGVTDEEALAVVVGVNEPAGDVVGGVATDLARCRVVDIDAVDSDLCLVAGG